MKFIILAALLLTNVAHAAPKLDTIDADLKSRGFTEEQIDAMWEQGDKTGDYGAIDEVSDADFHSDFVAMKELTK